MSPLEEQTALLRLTEKSVPLRVNNFSLHLWPKNFITPIPPKYYSYFSDNLWNDRPKAKYFF